MRFEVKEGSFRYPKGERQILNKICFSAESGDVVAILGPNGAGKTTLLRCSLGLLPWNSGRTELDGKDLRQIPLRSLWQQLAYVPQAAQASAPYTVEEMILLGRSSYLGAFRLPGEKDMEQVEKVLEQLHLEGLRKRRFSRLSGGEKQLVLIGRALAAGPKVLILDEPESNLDFKNQLLVLDAMSQLASEGMTCIFNTHYPAHALRRAGKALMLGRDGKFVFGGTRQVVTEANLKEFFGISAVIGDIETPGNIYQDVIPLSPGEEIFSPGAKEDVRAAATLSVILPDRTMAEQINELFHQVSPWIVGRMGMPHPEAGVYIINLILDAPVSRIRELANRLNLLPGVSVKATFAKEIRDHEKPRTDPKA